MGGVVGTESVTIASGASNSDEIDVLDSLLREANGFIAYISDALTGVVTIEVSRDVSPREWKTLTQPDGTDVGAGSGNAVVVPHAGFRYLRFASDGTEGADRVIHVAPMVRSEH